MERSLEAQVGRGVDAWLAWLPRWRPALHHGRSAPCRRCFGSPLLSAAGVESDVPHAVAHGLSTRMKTVIDRAVAEYTSVNLPNLQHELDQQAERHRARTYRPADDLEPEFDGLPLDPDPDPQSPFLFTLAGMADDAAAALPPLPPLSEEDKVALRQEVGLADEYANMVGREVCTILMRHRARIQGAVARFVEPQVQELLDELARSLDSPFDPRA